MAESSVTIHVNVEGAQAAAQELLPGELIRAEPQEPSFKLQVSLLTGAYIQTGKVTTTQAIDCAIATAEEINRRLEAYKG